MCKIKAETTSKKVLHAHVAETAGASDYDGSAFDVSNGDVKGVSSIYLTIACKEIPFLIFSSELDSILA